MDIDKLRELIQRGEGQTIEFKTSFAEDNEAIETLAAFASGQGGTVIFGVADNGSVRGASIGRNTLEGFANKTVRDTQPRLTPDVEIHDLHGKQVVTASVRPSGRYFRVGGKYFRRVGNTTVQIKSVDLIDELATLVLQAQSGTVTEPEKSAVLDFTVRREGDVVPKGGVPATRSRPC